MNVHDIGGRTHFVEMISPNGNRVNIPVSERHNGGRSLDFYRAKGFKTPDQVADEAQRRAEREELESLRAQVKAKR